LQSPSSKGKADAMYSALMSKKLELEVKEEIDWKG